MKLAVTTGFLVASSSNAFTHTGFGGQLRSQRTVAHVKPVTPKPLIEKPVEEVTEGEEKTVVPVSSDEPIPYTVAPDVLLPPWEADEVPRPEELVDPEDISEDAYVEGWVGLSDARARGMKIEDPDARPKQFVGDSASSFRNVNRARFLLPTTSFNEYSQLTNKVGKQLRQLPDQKGDVKKFTKMVQLEDAGNDDEDIAFAQNFGMWGKYPQEIPEGAVTEPNMDQKVEDLPKKGDWYDMTWDPKDKKDTQGRAVEPYLVREETNEWTTAIDKTKEFGTLQKSTTYDVHAAEAGLAQGQDIGKLMTDSRDQTNMIDAIASASRMEAKEVSQYISMLKKVFKAMPDGAKKFEAALKSLAGASGIKMSPEEAVRAVESIPSGLAPLMADAEGRRMRDALEAKSVTPRTLFNIMKSYGDLDKAVRPDDAAFFLYSQGQEPLDDVTDAGLGFEIEADFAICYLRGAGIPEGNYDAALKELVSVGLLSEGADLGALSKLAKDKNHKTLLNDEKMYGFKIMHRIINREWVESVPVGWSEEAKTFPAGVAVPIGIPSSVSQLDGAYPAEKELDQIIASLPETKGADFSLCRQTEAKWRDAIVKALNLDMTHVWRNGAEGFLEQDSFNDDFLAMKAGAV
uniref:Uncharacterized protein n=1 Tax=Chromera velia CCMP2878 TaxID=1169474 RepID=A0A0G4HYR6_9ALVE|mmetsp:Transcript_21383/g.42456  ORF Transcript_21383/g.42456 Transcript_21383/m.42456 type:complete len:631 (+) Transcript_21383:160-2052(+)|eukprot:Cvel_9562.t1-p1 / transcript=Cvel_9562.t1 / gene=Cvel_9562 / organism=Chromera_velia_CCMP2878 / gene_product=hypothetical protein / transcript_product=hypothetical protein / location=Cvel_scaffold554:22680-29407(-) / protein_length=630 / sequence_SO=supercontig / SO=protein_coding / is_pseudo=false